MVGLLFGLWLCLCLTGCVRGVLGVGVYCFRLCMIASGGLLIVLVNCYELYFTLLGLVYYLIYLVSLLLVDLRYLLCVGVFIVEL